MKPTPRHEVISLRLSDARLELLERYRRTFAEELHRDVSLSEAAFLALEDRATEMDRTAARAALLRTPTASLYGIRKQWESQHALSAAQWDVLAEYIRLGAEQERRDPPLRPAVPSRESYVGLLEAFRVVYEHRTEAASRYAWTYFGNLGGFLTVPTPFGDQDPDQQHQLLLTQIALLRDRLETEPWQRPGSVGHCLWLAVREECVDSTTLDHLLAPHWPVLWCLAARGHWIRHDRKPVRDVESEEDVPRAIGLPPPMTEQDLTVSFTPLPGADFVMSMAWTVRGFRLDISHYPELVEFRAMLDADGDRPWLGRHYAMTLDAGSGARRLFPTRRQMHVDLSANEWIALRDLLRRAWQTPELRHWLSELQQEYGEQG
jgi:hypothetical protein